MIVSDNVKHLAVADTRKLGIEVVKDGKFLDDLSEADPQRVRRTTQKSLGDLKDPPYSSEEMQSALRLRGAKPTAKGLANEAARDRRHA
jgi:hypothetical protein